ncbi:MAG: alpha/beta fold hydrolase [Microcella sp.]|uniref:alpha/beta hydrolase family protein n=1 Tax=Microcella sp. TaxID=1913979 RepID=UPI0027274C00|nr:alpha/beta fold hydrolase [Microcella sp.]MDO8336690.1 alpha/beta fold hydrolase [Microcella sp.]
MRRADLGGAPRPRPRGRSARRRRGLVLAIAGGIAGAAVAVVAASAVAAVTLARRVVTPVRDRPEDVRVLAVDARRATIRLSRTPDSSVPGRYGFWFDDGRGHARVGRILHEDAGSVTRVLESVQRGTIESALSGRWGGWFWLEPSDLGVAAAETSIRTPVGDAPAWFVPATDVGSGAGEDWIIHVHGRGASRAEGLRAVPLARALGWASLLISYRNDGDAPASTDGRYALGAAEWRDLEAAVAHARDAGARRIVVMGWSMGGAIALQLLVRSDLAGLVHGVVLDSPVIDWRTVLRFHAGLSGLPRSVGEVAMGLLGTPAVTPLVGSAEPIDLAALDLVARADELTVPVLVLHSDDDGYVPIDASLALADARPDLVTLERFARARHTRLWNLDPERWEGVIRGWLSRLDAPSARSARPRRRGAADGAPTG